VSHLKSQIADPQSSVSGNPNHQPPIGQMITTPTAPPTSTYTVNVANLGAQERLFLAGVISLLTDPARKAELFALKEGDYGLVMRANGKAQVLRMRNAECGMRNDLPPFARN